MANDRSKPLNRRAFIGASLAAPVLAGCIGNESSGGADGEVCTSIVRAPFAHGVASGDPLSDRVILWTRATPDNDLAPLDVLWAIATDPELQNIVASGTVSTDASRDYTVKVDVDGLQPNTTYYYRFHCLCTDSPIARTKTLPVGHVERARIAVVSCASLPHGFFNAYRRIAERPDLDFVLHLGDYIYEYPGVNPDAPDPEDYADQAAIDAGRQYSADNRLEIVTLSDYRKRHANYKRDADLAALHLQYAFITIWDDHEFADNTYRDGAVNHQPDEDGDWETRNAAARQAYFEWMPIRAATPGDTTRIDRNFQLGDLIDLLTLDTRWIGRSELGEGIENPSGIEVFRDEGIVADPARNLINAEQESRLANLLINGSAKWKLVAQQVVFAQWKLVGLPNDSNLETPGGQGGQFINLDQWDGYPRNRERVWNTLRDNAVNNTVFLTGDVHCSWAQEITEDPNNPLSYGPLVDDGSLAVEFVCTSVTSPGAFPATPITVTGFQTENPHIKYADLTRRGYMILDIDHKRAQGEWWFVDEHLAPNDGQSLDAVWKTDAGSNTLSVGVASEPRSDAPAPA